MYLTTVHYILQYMTFSIRPMENIALTINDMLESYDHRSLIIVLLVYNNRTNYSYTYSDLTESRLNSSQRYCIYSYELSFENLSNLIN